MIPSEHAEQVTFLNWFKLQYPKVLIFAIPNGGYRDPRTVQKLKAEGVVSGIPDTFIPEWGIWVEMKRIKGGTISKEQKVIHAYLEKIGQIVIVGRGWQDAKEKLLKSLTL